MIVYFLRHASAGQHKGSLEQDAKRPLDKEGIEQCGYVGRMLAAMDVQVEAIVSSPLKRASQTASLVSNELGFEGQVEFSPALAPEASFEAFREMLAQHANTTQEIMVVGHNPSLSGFLSLLLSGGASERAIDLKKGAVARLDYDGRKSGSMTWCVTPKIVRAAYDTAAKSSRPKMVRK
jgi:phosphohistidine phosphatase